MRKRLLKICLLVALTVICLTALCSCFDIDDIIVDLGLYSKNKKVNNEFTVIFRECAGVTLDDEEEAVQTVKSGSDVEFKITISSNYIYLGNTVGAQYDSSKGKIILEDVSSPVTIDLILVAKTELYCVDVYKNYENGYVSFLKGGAWSAEPTEVTLKATAPSGYVFRGWSSGDFIVNNGVVLSRNAEYTFTQSKDERLTKIYANFESEEQYLITYDPNGGTINGLYNTKTVEGEYSSLFLLQQTLHENNGSVVFSRDGYQLIGYSTEQTTEYADYTSANSIEGFSNLGGVCEVPKEDGELTLYAVWAKNTPVEAFSYKQHTYTNIWYGTDTNNKNDIEVSEAFTSSTTGIKITDFNSFKNTGSADTVVIPDMIDGREVISIASGAFENISGIKKVVIPKTVKIIESGAFSKCTDLVEVVFFDGVQYVSNSSFSSRITTVVLNSQKLPTYSNTAEGAFCLKYERVRALRDEKKIVVVSGSSSLNGLNSKMLYENFDGEYEIINYGTNAGTQSLFYLDVISKYMADGDIVIHAPEWSSPSSMGDSTLQWKLFRGNNQCYDIFREVNMSEYSNFWGAYQTFSIGTLLKEGDAGMSAVRIGYQYQREDISMNYCGDLLGTRTSRTKTEDGSMMFTGTMTSSRAANLNKVNKRIKDAGGTMLFSFGTADAIKVARGNSSWKNFCDDYTKQCADLLDCPVISNVGTYIMGENDNSVVSSMYHQMYNSAWHCTYYGANIRTVELTYDIKQYLAKGTDSWENYEVREQNRNTSAYKTYNAADWYQ